MSYLKIKKTTYVAFLFSAVLLIIFSPWGINVVNAITGTIEKIADATFGNIAQGLGYLLYSFAGLFTQLAAFILNASIETSIDSANFNIPAIESAWGVVRDFANIIFIFILLYIGISTMLNKIDYKKLLVRLIIVALLINFSLFFTRVIIDTSNILAWQFYDAASAITIDGVEERDLGMVFTQGLKLSSMFGEPGTDPDELAGKNHKIAIAYVFGAISLLIAAFVFFAGAIMFVIRTVVLNFLIILAPLAFVAWILPNLQSKAKQWWNALIGQAFFAPAFLFLAYVVSEIIRLGAFTSTDDTEFRSALLNPIDNSEIVLTFLLIIGFILASLIIAKELAGGVATASIGYAKRAIGAASGVGGYAGRRVIGGTSRRIRNSEWMKRQAAKGGAAGTFGRGAERLANYGATASYDTRAFIGGKEYGKAGGKGGYDAKVKTKAEKVDAQHKRVSESVTTRDGSTSTPLAVGKDGGLVYKTVTDKKTGVKTRKAMTVGEQYSENLKPTYKKPKEKPVENTNIKNKRVRKAAHIAHKVAHKVAQTASPAGSFIRDVFTYSRAEANREAAASIAKRESGESKKLDKIKSFLAGETSDLGTSGGGGGNTSTSNKSEPLIVPGTAYRPREDS